jgi:hypothetical protein
VTAISGSKADTFNIGCLHSCTSILVLELCSKHMLLCKCPPVHSGAACRVFARKALCHKDLHNCFRSGRKHTAKATTQAFDAPA